MRLLFATYEDYLPDVIDGGSLDIHHMMLMLRSQGHEAAIIAARMRERRHLVYRVRQKLAQNRILASRDTVNGYSTTKVLYWLVPSLLEQYLTLERPDLVIIAGRTGAEQLAQVAVDRGVPVIIRLVTAECAERLSDAVKNKKRVAELLANPMVKIVSNSHFIAAYVKTLLGLASEVDYPLIQLEDSVASNRTLDYITFVNPCQVKGLATALEVAALLPERRFVFTESWLLGRADRKELDGQLAKLPNVSFRRRSPNLRSLYRETAVLFMPSQIQEAFGRVIVEACANGIPVVASRVGGIPEAMGEAGVLLSASDPPEHWAEVIDEILSDPELYSRLRTRAFANARREEFNATVITARFLEIAKNHRHHAVG